MDGGSSGAESRPLFRMESGEVLSFLLEEQKLQELELGAGKRHELVDDGEDTPSVTKTISQQELETMIKGPPHPARPPRSPDILPPPHFPRPPPLMLPTCSSDRQWSPAAAS